MFKSVIQRWALTQIIEWETTENYPIKAIPVSWDWSPLSFDEKHVNL